MKKLVLVSISLLLTIFVFAQTKVNDPNAAVRSVKGFHAIKVSHGIQLLLNQGNTEAVAVSASEEEYRDRIKTVVENGVLRIYYDNDLLKQKGNKKLKAYVSFEKLDGLDASSGASIKVDGEIKVSQLGIETSSGAVFSGKVNVGSLEVDQSSGSVITVSGNAQKLAVETSSGSIFHGYELVVENCDAETSSGSGVQVTVNKELSVKASSGGNVSYKGNGVIRNIKTSSGGNVSKSR